MASQKFIKYSPLDLSGKQLDSEYEFKLYVLERSGINLLQKDLLGLLSNLMI